MAETTDPTATAGGGKGITGKISDFFKGRKGEAAEAALGYILGKKKKSLVKWTYKKFPWLSTSPWGGFLVSQAPLAVMLAKIATNNDSPVTRNLESLVQDFVAELEEGYEDASGNKLDRGEATATSAAQATATAVVDAIAKEYQAMGKFSVAVATIGEGNADKAAAILLWYTELDEKSTRKLHNFILSPETTKEGLASILGDMKNAANEFNKDAANIFVGKMGEVEKWESTLEVLDAIQTDPRLKDVVDQYLEHVRGIHKESFSENRIRFLNALYSKTKNKAGIDRLMGWMNLTPPMPEQITALLGVKYQTEPPKKLSFVEVIMGEGKTIDDANVALEELLETAEAEYEATKEKWR